MRERVTGGSVNTTTHHDPHFGVLGGANEMSTWIYSTDTRGQITSARKRLDDAAGAPFAPGWDASYAYDDIGNRVAWGQGSAQQTDLSDLEPTAYTTNALHQYTSISGVNAAHITGQAPAAQEVKINGVTADRAGHFYHRRLQDAGRTDPTLPHWLEVEITASTTLPGPEEVTAQRSGHLWQPPIPEEPVHDHDGNLIEDGRWHYTWDAENRLVQMLTRLAAVDAGAPAWRLSFAYDHQSRRIQKKVEVLTGGGWEVRSDARFIYDGWNVVAEIETKGDAWDAPGGTQLMPTRPAYLRRSWLWGEDLSGTMTGAGGVGGLLAVTRHARGGSAAETYWALSDLNGNVTGLVSASSTRVAVYEYDAFGRLLRENEPEPGLNPVRFSSKYQDVETGLVYYGFRYYSPEMGRWINRDPIEEQGGINLYGMVGNDPVNRVDVVGLAGFTYKDFSPNYSSLLSRRIPTNARHVASDSITPLASLFLSFYGRVQHNPSVNDTLDISSNYWLGKIAKELDDTDIAYFIQNTVQNNSRSLRSQADSAGDIGFRQGVDVFGRWIWWESISLRGFTLGIEMICRECDKGEHYGSCTATLQLYDYYDFKPNGKLQWIPYILFEVIPGSVDGVHPFHIQAEWHAKYKYNKNYEVIHIINDAY